MPHKNWTRFAVTLHTHIDKVRTKDHMRVNDRESLRPCIFTVITILHFIQEKYSATTKLLQTNLFILQYYYLLLFNPLLNSVPDAAKLNLFKLRYVTHKSLCLFIHTEYY